MDAEAKIIKGLKTVTSQDAHLLTVDVSERAITHRLGMYYQELFSKWDVDCEYNRRFGFVKEIEFQARDILSRMADLLRERGSLAAQNLLGELGYGGHFIDELKELERQLREPQFEYDAGDGLYYFILTLINGTKIKKQISPDVIVHKRNRKNNFIAIEAKKTSNVSIASREFDILKLQALILDERYGYKRGYFIDLPVGSTFVHFSNFEIVPDPLFPAVRKILPK